MTSQNETRRLELCLEFYILDLGLIRMGIELDQRYKGEIYVIDKGQD